MLKNGPTTKEKQLNGENKGPNKNEDVLNKVPVILFFFFVCLLLLLLFFFFK